MLFSRKIDRIIAKLFVDSISRKKVYRVSMQSCIVFNKVLIFGENKSKTSTLQNRYSSIPGRDYIHAEIDVINKAQRILSPYELSRSILIIVRYKKDATGLTYYHGKTKPCSGCSEAIRDNHISNIIYNDGTEYVFEKRRPYPF